MCLVAQPKKPKPAPIQRPAPVLEQDAPEATPETNRKSTTSKTGTKAYRAGSTLTIARPPGGSLNIPG